MDRKNRKFSLLSCWFGIKLVNMPHTPRSFTHIYRCTRLHPRPRTVHRLAQAQHTHTHTHTHTHACTHTYTHAHTHIHTRTHTHAHTQYRKFQRRTQDLGGGGGGHACGRDPKYSQLGGMGERCELPHRGLGQSPRSQRFLHFKTFQNYVKIMII